MTNRIGITSRYNQVEFNLINQLAKLNKTDTKSIQKFFVTKELSRLVEESKKQAKEEQERSEKQQAEAKAKELEDAQRNAETVATPVETSVVSGVEEQK